MENIEFNVDFKKGSIAEINIKASPELVKKAHKRAIKDVNKQVHIDGFRRGKAPDSYILEKYPKDVEKSWRRAILDISFIEFQKKEKIIPLDQDTTVDYDIKNFSLKEGAEVRFSYEIEPKAPFIDPKKFKLKKIEEKKIEKKEIDEAIRQAQFFFANWKEVDRPIKDGDFVILDLESIDTPPFQKVFSNTRFEVKDKAIATWMKCLLLGAQKDEVIEGISRPDDDLPKEEKKKFQPKKVRITIKKIEEATLPALDDDFAKKIGAKDKDDLRDFIKKMLKEKVEKNVLLQKNEQVNLFFLKNYPIDIPRSILAKEINSRKSDMLKDPNFKKNFEKMNSEEKKNFEAIIEKESRDAISLFYISKSIIINEKIEISPEELKNEVNQIVINNTPNLQEPDLKNIPKEFSSIALSKLFLKKSQEFILNNFEKKEE